VGDFKRVIELEPEQPNAYSELARLYTQAGQLDQAISTLSRLTEVAADEQKGRAFATRAHVHARKGDGPRAAADHAEACRRGYTPSCASAPARP
jgi:tetratricopeptide (TPR) repeat protein